MFNKNYSTEEAIDRLAQAIDRLAAAKERANEISMEQTAAHAKLADANSRAVNMMSDLVGMCEPVMRKMMEEMEDMM